MRIAHYCLFGVAAATFGYLTLAPGASAQEEAVPAPMPSEPAPPDGGPSPEQLAEIDSWPSEKKAAYDTWPDETKGYYWTLSDERQNLFWALADSDKIALTAMTGPEREAAWEQVEARAGAMSTPQ